jgi:CheY-like chemotaxis protein
MSTVLVVEDDPALREVVQALLEAEGFSTIGACNGADAMGILKAAITPPCLILVDLNMPVMNGWQLLSALSGDQRWADIPRVVMTAIDHDRNIGITPWIRKPFEADHLMSAVRQACTSG